MRRLRIGMSQINVTVAIFRATCKDTWRYLEARSLDVDLLPFPELAVCGYPPEDLLFKPKFIEENIHTWTG